MMLNKIFKGSFIILTAITVSACSPNKEIISNESSENITNTSSIGILDNDRNNSISNEEQMRIQMHHLQSNNTIYFDLDKYSIRPEFIEMLDLHKDFLLSNPTYKIIIEGHADERGTSEYNISLGERRANAIKIYLQSKGISSDQISIVSYGKEKPAVLGHDEIAYAKNRRAIIVY